jgi:hypothetical protein
MRHPTNNNTLTIKVKLIYAVMSTKLEIANKRYRELDHLLNNLSTKLSEVSKSKLGIVFNNLTLIR